MFFFWKKKVIKDESDFEKKKGNSFKKSIFLFLMRDLQTHPSIGSVFPSSTAIHPHTCTVSLNA